MRTSLTIFALATLCFGQDAFAQAAPKEVVVVNGEITMNNTAVNPASVMVENGVLNPVPVIDITPDSNPLINISHGGRLGQFSTTDQITLGISASPAKLVKIKTIYFQLKNMHRNVLVKCQYQGLRTFSTVPIVFWQYGIDTRVFREATSLPDGTPHDVASAEGSYEFVDAPWAEGGQVTCEVRREDLSAHQRPYRLDVYWFGEVRDPPAP